MIPAFLCLGLSGALWAQVFPVPPLVPEIEQSTQTFQRDMPAELRALSSQQLGSMEYVFSYIQKHYIEPVKQEQLLQGARKGLAGKVGPFSREQLYYGAMSGAVDTLHDAHSQYFPPEDTQVLEDVLHGSQVGLGLTLPRGRQAGEPLIVFPQSGSPAEKAGIKFGDEVLEVDGVAVRAMTTAECDAKLSGPENSSVVLTILRENAPAALTIYVSREKFEGPNVFSRMLRGKKGYVYLNSFRWEDSSHNTAVEVLMHIYALQQAGASGFILDLRHNGGGDIRAVQVLASAFLKRGEVWVGLKDRQGRQSVLSPPEDGMFVDLPVRILVDSESASGSEIFTAALQENHRAKVYGERTYGKGSAQSLITFKDDSVLALTIHRWYTPSGRSIDGERDGTGGVLPDVLKAGQPKAVVNILLELNQLPIEEPLPDPVLEEALK